MNSKQILSSYLHFRDGAEAEVVPVSASFWEELARGQRPELDEGRLMTAFTFSEPWTTWERHPAGDELVMLLSGAATLVLEVAGAEQAIELANPGAYVLVSRGTWHTARTSVETTLLFLTPGAGTEHKPVVARARS